MTERQESLARITKDLETYVDQFCPCSENGSFNDFSGEKCNDALIMLQEALGQLSAES